MPTRARRALRILVAACVVAAAARGADDARATGSWTVGGETVALVHARAFLEADPFGHGLDPCLLASNQAVPDEAVPDDDQGIAKLLGRMRESGLRALQVCFARDGSGLRAVNDVFTFHPEISPGRYGLQGFHRFAPASPAVAGRIAGKLTGSGTTMSGDGAWSDELELALTVPPAAQ